MLALMVAFTFEAAPSSASPRERPLVFADLQYPAAALAARTEGTVVVQVTTDGSGRIVGAEPVVAPDALAQAAVANVKGWTLAGGPRTDWIVFRFDIDPGACNDDSRSLFRMPYANLAVVSACTTPGRRGGPPPEDPLYLRSVGATPGYPHVARNANVRGVVILELSVDGDGAVKAARALNELPLLAPAAVAHAKTWRVWPGRPGPRIAVYEFALENFVCEPESSTFLTRVNANYLRLTGCIPVLQASARGGAGGG